MAYVFKKNDKVLVRNPCVNPKHAGLFIMTWKGPYTINSVSYSNICTLKSGKKILKTPVHVEDLKLVQEISRDIKNEEVVINIMDNHVLDNNLYNTESETAVFNKKKILNINAHRTTTYFSTRVSLNISHQYQQKGNFFVKQEKILSIVDGSVEKKLENVFNSNLYENNRQLKKEVGDSKNGQQSGISENIIVISDDDDCVIIDQCKPIEDRMFNPIGQYWQEEKCLMFELQLIHCLNFNENKVLGTPTDIKSIIGDGNCMYRAICYWVTGNEDDHFIIRQLISEVTMIFYSII